MKLRPVTLGEARAFVESHHRHSRPPQGWLFGVGLDDAGTLAAVAIAGRPMARMLQDGYTVEITRVCTLGQKNAPSRLYGAICRAAAALGYRKAITYTLITEAGSSPRAAGFHEAERLGHRETWGTPSRPRQDVTIWGQRTLPDVDRIRWERVL